MARLRGLASRDSPAALAAQLAELAKPRPAALPARELLEALLVNLKRNGATACVVDDRAGAVAELARYIAARQPGRRFVCGHDPRLAAFPWRDGGLLPRFGVAGDGDRVGVSYARGAVAETGSLFLWADRNNPAVNSLLCEDHVILVDLADVHAGLEAVWADDAFSSSDTRPRGLMLVSGPSSTADIAMQLVYGAHGPRALHVIVVRTAQRAL
jgi:L-lactate dehydrogenase complex protein LldG